MVPSRAKKRYLCRGLHESLWGKRRKLGDEQASQPDFLMTSACEERRSWLVRLASLSQQNPAAGGSATKAELLNLLLNQRADGALFPHLLKIL